MRTVYRFSVAPYLPPELADLGTLAYNLWWSWNPDAIQLFLRLDRDLWEETGHNPVAMLGRVSQHRLEELAKDEAYLHSLGSVMERFREAMDRGRSLGHDNDFMVAYFALEFGIHEALPVYSGGLGVLSGDYLKAASEIGLPLVGVSLLYREGYFRQYLTSDGWQQETYPDNDFYNMPLLPVKDADGSDLVIPVEFPDHTVYAKVWKVQVGRTSLILLDCNIEQNSVEAREITAQLYGGDLEMRIRQEYLLGIGGVEVLKKLDIHPTVYHMNEGHSAFLGLKRIQDLMAETGMSFSEAREACAAGNVFTTHTPVPAGIDKFPPALMDRYFWKYREEVGISRDDFLALGREHPENHEEPFSLAVLAIKLSNWYNGVSRLHGRVSRHMWRHIWPGVPEDEIPITHITNGVHINSWVSPELGQLLDRYLGPRWREFSEQSQVWDYMDRIPNAELWRTHERRRERLVAFARLRLKNQLIKRGATEEEIKIAEEVLDPDALTIGFARRFATYKRAILIFRDPDRLARILGDPERPVQMIFAGKAHPRDNEGKEFIRRLVQFARDERFRLRVVFLEDYDMNVARYMLQGVDVWLNTPRRPLEASGTSGMKAAANGALNFSTLDGWWAEGFEPDVGWSIGKGEEYEDLEYQDLVEAQALYDTLESDIVPVYYDRGHDGIPRRWVYKMKQALKKLAPQFNINRMALEYMEKLYRPASARWHEISADSFSMAKRLHAWKGRLAAAWPHVRITDLVVDHPDHVVVGQQVGVRCHVHLAGLSPDDVKVQALSGPVDVHGSLVNPGVFELKPEKDLGDGVWLYSGQLEATTSGQQGMALRVVPFSDMIPYLHSTGLIKWA